MSETGTVRYNYDPDAGQNVTIWDNEGMIQIQVRYVRNWDSRDIIMILMHAGICHNLKQWMYDPDRGQMAETGTVNKYDPDAGQNVKIWVSE